MKDTKRSKLVRDIQVIKYLINSCGIGILLDPDGLEAHPTIWDNLYFGNPLLVISLKLHTNNYEYNIERIFRSL